MLDAHYILLVMKKYILILIFFLPFTFNSLAQMEYRLFTAADFYHTQKFASSNNMARVLTEKDIDGSPYLNDNFINGSIYLSTKVQYADIPLRYNIYNDEIEFEKPDKEVIALGTPETVEKVVFGNYTMEYIPYSIAKKVKRGYFIVLLDGKGSLYARPVVEYEAPKEPGAYQGPVPAKFIQKSDKYFIRFGQDAAQLIENKKELSKLFPDHNHEIEVFVKKNKINTRNRKDLKSLLEYYNSL